MKQKEMNSYQTKKQMNMIRGHTRLAFSLTRYGLGSDQGTMSTAKGKTWGKICLTARVILVSFDAL